MRSGVAGGAWPFGKDAPTVTTEALHHYRLQLYNCAVAESSFGLYPQMQPYCMPYEPRLALSMSLLQQRALQPEEKKPPHSYIGLIAMAILSSPDLQLVLSNIYQHILDHYPYFRNRGSGWRNSIRHNLSLNDCFVKAARSANGKGHYWAIHPANIEDFRKGDFRRCKAQEKVKKHTELAVNVDGEGSPSPSSQSPPKMVLPLSFWGGGRVSGSAQPPKRRFDVASLLAPDYAVDKQQRRDRSCDEEPKGDIYVVASDQQERGDDEEVRVPLAPVAQYAQLGAVAEASRFKCCTIAGSIAGHG